MNKTFTALAAVIAMSILPGNVFGQDAEQSQDIASMCRDEAQGLEPEDATAYIERCTEDANANYNYEGYDQGADNEDTDNEDTDNEETDNEETLEEPAENLD